MIGADHAQISAVCGGSAALFENGGKPDYGCHGAYLADNRRIQLGALTRPRAIAAMPFAGRFRIIDFTLSNMVNSGIKRVGVVALTKYNLYGPHGDGRTVGSRPHEAGVIHDPALYQSNHA